MTDPPTWTAIVHPQCRCRWWQDHEDDMYLMTAREPTCPVHTGQWLSLPYRPPYDGDPSSIPTAPVGKLEHAETGIDGKERDDSPDIHDRGCRGDARSDGDLHVRDRRSPDAGTERE